MNNSGYERENKGADGQNQFMRKKLRGVELAEGLNLTVATGILWACHGNGPDPS